MFALRGASLSLSGFPDFDFETFRITHPVMGFPAFHSFSHKHKLDVSRKTRTTTNTQTRCRHSPCRSRLEGALQYFHFFRVPRGPSWFGWTHAGFGLINTRSVTVLTFFSRQVADGYIYIYIQYDSISKKARAARAFSGRWCSDVFRTLIKPGR